MKKKFSRVIAHYLPQCLLLFSILTSNVLFPASVIAQEIENTNNVTQEETVPIDTSEDILEEGISTSIYEEEEVVEPLFVFENGIYTVKNVIQGEEYVYPDNNDVRVKFTEVTQEGNLVIKRVELTEEQKELLNTKDSYGWDITSSMENGTFKYNLTLPNTQGNEDIEVKYTEDGEVYTTIEGVVVNEDVVNIEGLEHFSIYYVVNHVLSAKPVSIEAETIPGWCNITISAGESIQDAINKSSVENPLTICIKPGEYKENLIIKKKPVSLVGLKDKVVIIGANAEKPTIHIVKTDGVTIDGFTFQGTNGSYGAIHIENSNNCTIQNNVFLKNSLDIFTDHGSQHTITNNKFNGGKGDNRLAIKGNSTENSLMNNAFSNYSTAIAIGEEHKIYNNQFVNNTIQIETGTNTKIIEDYLSKNTFDRAVVVRKNPITVGKIFSRIQDAIDASEGGNTIQVLSGTYKEIVNINKSLSLVGVKENPPTILGRFEINTSGKVNIKNMNFQVPVPVANPVGNSADSININKVGELYVDNCNFNGSELFLNGGRGIISNDSQSIVTVENSTFIDGYYIAIQGKYNELNIKDTTISNCKSGINFQGGNNLAVKNTDISVVAQAEDRDTYAVRFASESANTGKDMILNGGKYVVDKKGFTADPGIYHSAIIVRSGASGVLKANNLSLGGEVVNLSSNKLDAINNWWGDASGPKDTVPNDGSILNQNPNGKGSSAIGAVKYAPWYKDAGMKNLTSANAITQDATNLNLYDATLNGTNGDYDATGHSFWVSLSSFSTDSPNIPSNVYSTQDFGAIKANTDFSASLSSITNSGIPRNLTPITPNTTYYYVAWSLVDGTWYPGEVKSFTTLPINAPTNGAPNGTYITTNEFDFTWDASTGVSSITYEFQSSLNPSQVDGVLTTELWKSGTLPTNMIHSSGASDGTWYWQVRAKDAAGNYSDWSEIWTVTIDTTPPTIPQNLRFENPSLQCEDITSNYHITPTWDESEDMLSGLYRYEYFVNTPGVQGWTIYRHTNSYPAVFNQGEGKYTFKVRAIDNVNNISAWSNECTITYDKTPAEITITPSRPSDFNQWYSTRPTFSNTFPTFEISTNEESQIEYNWNNTSWNTYSGAIKYEENGRHILYIKATDLAGNTTEKQVDVWQDFSNPERIFTINDDDNLVRGTLQLNFTDVIDPSGSKEIDRIEIWVDGSGYKGSATKVSEGVYKFDLDTTQFNNGNYTIRPSIFDMAGNRTRPYINITIDNTPPVTPTATLTANGISVLTNGYTSSEKFTFNLSSSEDTTRYQLKYWNNIPTSRFKENSPWNPTDLRSYSSELGVYNDKFTQGEGKHYFVFSACDMAGNCSGDSTPFVVTYDKTAPRSIITSLSSGYITKETPEIIGNTTDGYSVDKVVLSYTDYNMETLQCGETWTELKTIENQNNEIVPFDWSYNEWTLGDGFYCIKVSATDIAGNIEQDTYISSLTYDSTPPSITVFNIDSGTLNISANDLLSGTDKIQVSTGNEVWKDYTPGMNINDLIGTQPGTYTIYVKVTDKAGNTTEDSMEYTIPQPAPAPTQIPATTGGAVLGATTTTTTKTTTKGITKTTSPISTTQTEEILETTSIEEPSVLGERCENKKKVSGNVYLDKNKDNEMNENEEGIKDITLTIQYTDEEGNIKTEEEVNTDEKGYWETQLCSGKYNIVVKEDTLPQNIEVAEVLSLTVSDNEKETIFNIQALDTRNFWQKYWYLIVGGLAIIVIGYSSIKNRKKEEI